MDIRLRHLSSVYLTTLVFGLLFLFILFMIEANEKPAGGILGDRYNVQLSLITSPDASKTNTIKNINKPILEKKEIKKEVIKKPQTITKTEQKPVIDKKQEKITPKIKKENKTTKSIEKQTKIDTKSQAKTSEKTIQSNAIYDKKKSIKQTPQMIKGAKKAGLNGISYNEPNYINNVLIHLQSYRYYPPLAMRRHLTGNAKVELFLNCQGKLINYKILKSTSVEMLDNAAKKMIEDAEPYPTPKNCQHNFNINVPIEFKIKN